MVLSGFPNRPSLISETGLCMANLLSQRREHHTPIHPNLIATRTLVAKRSAPLLQKGDTLFCVPKALLKLIHSSFVTSKALFQSQPVSSDFLSHQV